MMSRKTTPDEGLYQAAVELVLHARRAPTSLLMTELMIGYSKALLLVERMEREGVVSAPGAGYRREVLRPHGIER